MTRLLLHSDEIPANESRIYHYIYEQKSISKAAIAHHLRLSLPTVTQHVTSLLDGEIIRKGEFCDSTGGRKAQAYVFNAEFRYAVGVDIWQESYEAVILDLYGNVIRTETVSLVFENTERYYKTFCESLICFIQASGVDSSRILGVGISVQGIIAPDGESVRYGDAMNTVGLRRRGFQEYLNWPCLLLHNVDSAAFAESWYHENLGNAFYLFLCDYFGASLIIDGQPYKGDAETGSTIEHMCLVPDGQVCYCGKRGCVEAYCSEKALLTEAKEDEKTFFKKLRAGEPKEEMIWQNYLKKVALVIDNIRMVIHSQVIIGGTMVGKLIPEDLTRLEKEVESISSFKSYDHFITRGICGRDSGAKGAALQYIITYLNAQ